MGGEAEARKERLKALRQAAAEKGESNADEKKPVEKSVLKFRNYEVKDEKIQHEKVGGDDIVLLSLL